MFRRDFFWFEADKGQGGGGEPPADNDDPTSTGEGKEPGTNNGATFTQADMDRLAGTVRKEAVSRFIKDLGLKSTDDLKAIIQAKQEADDAAKSDLEKAQTERDQAKAETERTQKRMQETLLKAEFTAQAAEQVADIDLAFLAAQNMGLLNGEGGVAVDLAALTVTGMEGVVKALLKEKPILKKTAPAQAAGTGGGEGGNDRPGPSPEQEERVRRTYGIRPRRQ